MVAEAYNSRALTKVYTRFFVRGENRRETIFLRTSIEMCGLSNQELSAAVKLVESESSARDYYESQLGLVNSDKW